MPEPLNGNYFEDTLKTGQTDVQCNLSLSSKATCNFTLPINPFIKDQWNFPYSLKLLSQDGPFYILRGRCISFPENRFCFSKLCRPW